MNPASTLFIGLLLGLRHATDPDHVVAMGTIVTRDPHLRRAIGTGVFWGIGHTVTVLLVGVLMLVGGVRVPERVVNLMDLAVAAMLIALGVLALRTRKVVPTEAPGLGERILVSPLRPLLVGILHGLAGSAAMTLIALATIQDERGGRFFTWGFSAWVRCSEWWESPRFSHSLFDGPPRRAPRFRSGLLGCRALSASRPACSWRAVRSCRSDECGLAPLTLTSGRRLGSLPVIATCALSAGSCFPSARKRDRPTHLEGGLADRAGPRSRLPNLCALASSRASARLGRVSADDRRAPRSHEVEAMPPSYVWIARAVPIGAFMQH